MTVAPRYSERVIPRSFNSDEMAPVIFICAKFIWFYFGDSKLSRFVGMRKSTK